MNESVELFTKSVCITRTALDQLKQLAELIRRRDGRRFVSMGEAACVAIREALERITRSDEQ